jgi:hypothetical protein
VHFLFLEKEINIGMKCAEESFKNATQHTKSVVKISE